MKLARFILFLAGMYNLAWGLIILLFPDMMYFGGVARPFDHILIRCIAMLVGLYGICYYISSLNPQKYWSLIFIGLLGKVFGPLGSFYYIYNGTLEPGFLVINVFNDFIWIIPFFWVLIEVYKRGFEEELKVEKESLYQSVLGNSFNNLSPNLYAFHASKVPIKVRGKFKVERGKSSIAKWMAKVAKLPEESPSEEVELVVSPMGDKEKWSRCIGKNCVDSLQWRSDKFIVEKFGPVEIYLKAEVINGNLIIQDVTASVIHIPFPPFFSPRVYAIGRDKDDGVEVDVDISFFPFGRIIRYSGLVRVIPSV